MSVLPIRLRSAKSFKVLLLSAVCACSLSACAAALTSMDSGNDNVATLAQDSYGAADMLIQQSRSFIDRDTKLEITPLTDLDNPGEVTNFGHMISSQIASRFVQLGYNVVLSPMEPGFENAAVPMQTAQPGSGVADKTIIAGRYARAKNDVLINLRLIENGTGRVLASYDYAVDYTRDVKELSQTHAEKTDKSIF
ncbi:MAG TPA: hypothetical protein EYG18_07475 [Micavibrio sp.]|nr:hypothetical protein [Micavibrio sp.]HIL29093.1 hypothetical protein [Micavibrio sp.]